MGVETTLIEIPMSNSLFHHRGIVAAIRMLTYKKLEPHRSGRTTDLFSYSTNTEHPTDQRARNLGTLTPRPGNLDLNKKYLPSKENNKLRGAGNFVERVIQLAGAAQKTGHWKSLSTEACDGTVIGKLYSWLVTRTWFLASVEAMGELRYP